MKKKILIVLGVLALIIVTFAMYIGAQPGKMEITRSAVMNADASEVVAQVNDFSNWNDWSPWAKMDPNAKYEEEGPDSGVGSIMRWDGNEEVGKGSSRITKSVPNERIELDLVFEKPMEDVAQVVWVFEEADGGVKVTWTMLNDLNFAGKAMSVFMDFDKMVGDQYEKGLMNIKEIVESDS
ncbi:MAG: SRPBCC family protein [Verrucomicrobiota bacterium]